MGTKTSLKKSEVALLQILSRLFQLFQFVKCLQLLLELNSKRLYQSSGREKESRCLVFKSFTKREIRHFHVVVVQWQRAKKCTWKRDARAKLLFCSSKPIAFLLFSLKSSSSLLLLQQKDATLFANNSQHCWMLHVASFCTFGISREPRTSRSHVTRALPSGLRFEVHVCTARPRFRSEWFTARFFAP